MIGIENIFSKYFVFNIRIDKWGIRRKPAAHMPLSDPVYCVCFSAKYATTQQKGDVTTRCSTNKISGWWDTIMQIQPSKISRKTVPCDNDHSPDCREKVALGKGYQDGGRWRCSERYIRTSAGVWLMYMKGHGKVRPSRLDVKKYSQSNRKQYRIVWHLNHGHSDHSTAHA